MSRMASICTHLTQLQLSYMYDLSVEGKMSLVSLFIQIIQNNPPLEILGMQSFSWGKDKVQNIGELVLESLLSSSINSITELNFINNKSWFWHPSTK